MRQLEKMEGTDNQYGQNKTTEFINNILNNIDDIGIEGCFDKVYLKHLSAVKVNKIKSKTIEVLKNAVKETLVTAFDSAGLPLRFEELQTLEERYRDRTETWRPPGDPKDHTRSVRVQSVLKLQKEIDVLIEIQLLELKTLIDKVRQAKIDNPVARINEEISNRVTSCEYMLEENETKIKSIIQPSVIDHLRL